MNILAWGVMFSCPILSKEGGMILDLKRRLSLIFCRRSCRFLLLSNDFSRLYSTCLTKSMKLCGLSVILF
jgi:hypothetical protein